MFDSGGPSKWKGESPICARLEPTILAIFILSYFAVSQIL